MNAPLRYVILCLSILAIGYTLLRSPVAKNQSIVYANTVPIDYTIASRSDLRLHAAELFSTFTAGFATPVWEMWKDQCEVHLLDGCLNEPHAIHSFRSAPQQQIKLPTDARSKVLQSIYYNDSASKTILDNHLYLKQTLDHRLDLLKANSAPISDMQMSDFGSDAIIVKTMWQSITVYGPHEDRKCPSLTPLYAYDSQKILEGDDHQLPHLSGWKNKVCVDPDETKKTQCIETAGNPYPSYSLGCFNYREVSHDDFQETPVEPNDLLTECFTTKCYLIMVSVHIMTRETPNWVWMTFWWTNEHKVTHSDKWSFFDSNASVNNTDHIANPYLEGQNPGMRSNCMQCHRLAVYTPSRDTKTDLSSYRPPSDALQLHLPTCYFANALQTHFLWTITSHQNLTTQQPPVEPCP